ncbi:MAG: carboxypeptidase regulatory-like domain-containing protein [Acidobacteriaceae bacterium]|nr:carboxypeptidase regulatory-like domain-containing protein [Acidobacteriaceae bacterium]
MSLCRSLALLLTATSIFRGQQPPSYTIAGTIVDHLSGRPLPGILVSVTTVARNSEPISVLTAADGRFTFPNLVAGKYALAAERRGARPELYLQHGEFSTAIVTGPGLDSEHITFPLSAPARLSGTVLDSEGDPVPGAQIMLFTQVQVDGLPQLMQVNNAMASQSGAFRFSNLRGRAITSPCEGIRGTRKTRQLRRNRLMPCPPLRPSSTSPTLRPILAMSPILPLLSHSI